MPNVTPIGRPSFRPRAPDNSTSRYRPPQMLGGEVRLARVAEQLEDGQGGVWLLTGPPGCGKTVALLQHHRQLTAAEAATGWLNLSRQDNDLATLRRHLAGAFNADEEDPAPPPGTTLFIDGVEHIHDDEACACLEGFMLAVPSDSTICATVQSVRGERLHEGRLRGIVRQIAHADFRLSSAEASRVLGPEWSMWEVEQLNTLVDGWAAGLRFLSLDPAAARRITNDMDGNAAIPAAMADYFDDLVCAALSEANVTALMEASVFERFTAEVLADLPDYPYNWALIEQHIRANLFLAHLDTERRWVGFNPAFSRHLRQRLAKRRPARFEALQRHAAGWFHEHGSIIDAIRHASRLPDLAYAARIIESAGALRSELHYGIVVDFQAPADQVDRVPLVSLSQVYRCVRTGHLAEGRRLFEALRARTRDFTLLDEGTDHQAVTGLARIIEMVLDVSEDRPVSDEQVDSLENMLAASLGSEPVLVGGIASMLALAYVRMNRYDEATRVCDLGIDALRDLKSNTVSLFLRIHQARAALALDNVDKAALYIEDAWRIARTDGIDGSYHLMITRILRAELHYENNELDMARTLLADGLGKVQESSGWVDLYGVGFGVLAAIAGIMASFEAANEPLLEGERLARRRGLPRLGLYMTIQRLREHVRAQQWREAIAIIESAPVHDVLSEDSVSVSVLQMQVPALLETARLMTELGRFEDSSNYLERVNKSWLGAADQRLRFTFHLLTMRNAYGRRRYNAAVEHMQAAVDLAAQAGLIRRAINNRLALLEVFDWSLRNGRHFPTRMAKFVEEVLRSAAPSDGGAMNQRRVPRQGQASVTANFTLSPRESEIIALVAEGLLTKEIAFRLSISEGTVKSHRKKIHEKLGATSRSQAIARARELMII